MARNKLNRYLYQDKSSGVWYFRKKVRGIDEPYRFSLDTKSVVEARQKRDEYLKQIDIHGHLPKMEPVEVSPSMRFGEIAQQWKKIIEPQVSETTLFNYRKVMNSHILPRFGNMPIDAITSLNIESFISELKCRSKTKQNILTPFRLVMKFAKKHQIIQSNPFADVDPIKKTKSKANRVLSLAEIKLFIDALDPQWRPLFILLFFTGVRIAEASALKWKNVDLANATIRIRENLLHGEGGKLIQKAPKTDSSIREVKVPGMVIEALREQRKRTWQGDGENLVFLNRAGRPIHRHTLNHIVIIPALKKSELSTHISIKDTRASFITNALDNNERMSFVQKQVGHTTTRMIVDHYYRHTPATDDGSRLEKAWNSDRIVSDQNDGELQVIGNKNK